MKLKPAFSILILSLIMAFWITSCTKGVKVPTPVNDTTLTQQLVLHAWKSNSCFNSNPLSVTSATFTFKSDGTGSYVPNSGSAQPLIWQVDANKVVTIGGSMAPGPFLKLTIPSYSSAALNISEAISYDPYGSKTYTTASTGCSMLFTR